MSKSYCLIKNKKVRTYGPVVENLPANAGDMGSIPGQGRSHMLQSNQVPVPQLLKPKHPRAHAPKQEKPLQ